MLRPQASKRWISSSPAKVPVRMIGFNDRRTCSAALVQSSGEVWINRRTARGDGADGADQLLRGTLPEGIPGRASMYHAPQLYLLVAAGERQHTHCRIPTRDLGGHRRAGI